MQTINIKIPKNKAEKLDRLAFSYGTSVENLIGQILKTLSLDIREDSFDNYTKESISSFKRGIADWQTGKTVKTL